ncbi:MAG: 30S ribosomal protein S6 [Candidatus Pacebacteria bacterium]|nr:30S ribosomal protein S6 [Candidatus Paceibacterota bacterium]
MTDNNETIVDNRIYEISFIFDNKLDETTALKKAETLKQSIATLGGSFISEEAPYMRELAYEMIKVQNNINVRFNEGYFGWVKFDLSGEKVKELEKGIKSDEEVVRYLIVRTVAENTVFTKRAPVIKAETLVDNEDGPTDEVVATDINIDTTTEPDVVAPVVETVASEEVK